MDLQKGTITPKGKGAITVLFNPTNYTIAKANQIAETGIPGLDAPILQYVHGNTRTLSMDLFFDTYEDHRAVTSETTNIYNLLEIDADTHAPPVCDIRWGTFFSFTGVLDHVSGQFTLFLADGTPVRATLNVSFKEYIEVAVLVMRHPTHSADHHTQRVVKSGDRIDTIAGEEYGDPASWRVIAAANDLEDPGRLLPGGYLTIPPTD
jgi:nucleoid-associated protein YgaU